MFIAVASQDDLRTALYYYYEGYDKKELGSAFIDSNNYWKWLIAVWLQFTDGVLGLATTFLLIVESDVVVGLVLDFTAVEFITLLDNAFFALARQGFMGPKSKRESLDCRQHGVRADKNLNSLAFLTEAVMFNSPDNGDSPTGITWFSTRESDLANTERLGRVNTILLCAVCDADNPCQNGNELG